MGGMGDEGWINWVPGLIHHHGSKWTCASEISSPKETLPRPKLPPRDSMGTIWGVKKDWAIRLHTHPIHTYWEQVLLNSVLNS